jgi:hypothetical protein
VAVVQSAHFRKPDHCSEFGRLYCSSDRRVLLHRRHRDHAAESEARCPQGKASSSCREVHSDLQCAVTAKCIGRRRSCETITKTNRTRNVIVQTTKKSAETQVGMWFFRKVRQCCDGGFWCRTTSFATVATPAGRALTVPQQCAERPNLGWPDSFKGGDPGLHRIPMVGLREGGSSISHTAGIPVDANR